MEAVLRAWDAWGVWPSATMARLRACFEGKEVPPPLPPPPPPQQQQHDTGDSDSDLDGTPFTLSDFDLDDVDEVRSTSADVAS